jgi:hypothetical protein
MAKMANVIWSIVLLGWAAFSLVLLVVFLAVQPGTTNHARPVAVRQGEMPAPLDVKPLDVKPLDVKRLTGGSEQESRTGSDRTRVTAAELQIPIDPVARAKVYFADRNDGQAMFMTMQFGVVGVDPKKKGDDQDKETRLTYDTHGRTNSTVLKIDGLERRFGVSDGLWEKLNTVKGDGTRKTPASVSEGKWGGARTECVWITDDKAQVTQIVEVVPGEPVETADGLKRHLDTVLVRYRIKNKHTAPRRVGLRFLLDTLIGMKANGEPNDGVPFTVPGLPGLVDDFRDFPSPDKVPAFVEVLQNPDLKSPGLVARLNFRVGASKGKDVEPPSRVSLTRWTKDQPYDIQVQNMGDDSAVAIYWNEAELAPGKEREVGFSYGLGSVSSASGQLGLSVGGDFTPGGDMTVTAYVNNAQPGDKVILKLPDGLKLAEGENNKAEQEVPAAGAGGRLTPVTWHVRSTGTGTFEITVERARNGSTVATQKKRVQIKTESLF